MPFSLVENWLEDLPMGALQPSSFSRHFKNIFNPLSISSLLAILASQTQKIPSNPLSIPFSIS